MHRFATVPSDPWWSRRRAGCSPRGALPQRGFRVRAQGHGPAVGAGQPALPVQQSQVPADREGGHLEPGGDSFTAAKPLVTGAI